VPDCGAREALDLPARTASCRREAASAVEYGSLNRPGVSFWARRRGDGFATGGEPAVFVGHRLESRPGEPDDGAYVEWCWTGSELVVQSDRYGLIPAYYAAGPDFFAISTSLGPLLEAGVSDELDEEALAVFLRLGTFLADDTPYRAIKALPPGTDFVWKGAGHEPTGRRPLGEVEPGLTRAEAVRRYGTLFQCAVERRAGPSAEQVVALSGGMDSRHVLLELCRLGRRPSFAVTAQAYPGEPSEDVELARAVSRYAGVPHVVLEPDDAWLAAERRKNEETGFGALEHTWGIALADSLRGRASAVFDGLAGDVFTDCRGVASAERVELFRRGRFAQLASDFLGPDVGPLPYLSRELAGRMTWDRAVRRFCEECERYAAAPNPPAAFWFWNRTRRTVSALPYGSWQRSLHVLTPFLDHALFDFMAGLPWSLVDDFTFHAETIRREFPALAHVPFCSSAGRPSRAASARHRRMARAALRCVLSAEPPSYLSRRYVTGRLARALVDRRYARASAWLPPLVVYLSQLEACGRPGAEDAARGSAPDLYGSFALAGPLALGLLEGAALRCV
jgi:hypothetical protein